MVPSWRTWLGGAASTGSLLALLGAGAALAQPTGGYAQESAASSRGQELFVEVLGCSGCHGRSGEGGMGPTLAESRLTLPQFIKQTRLPEDVMPPFLPLLASDEQLAIIYDWLGGVDRVATPPPVHFELEGFDDVTGGSPGVVAFSATISDEPEAAALPAAPGLVYRITLLERDVTPLAGQPFEFRAAEDEEWRDLETDRDGRAILEPRADRATAEALRRPDGIGGELRLSLPSGRYSFVVEALHRGNGPDTLVLGLGSAVLEVE